MRTKSALPSDTSALDLKNFVATCRSGRILFVARVTGRMSYLLTLRITTMSQYFLSVHSADCQTRQPMSEEEKQQAYSRIHALEHEMRSAGAWVFTGRLHGPETATVVRMEDGEMLTTDGPYVESKEHLGGFYILEAEDLDAALAWAAKVTDCIGAPIEVRPFWDLPEA